MIPKDKLIKKLENIAELEEEGVKLISRSLKTIIQKSDLEEEKKAEVIEIVEIIARESEGHKTAILETIKMVKESTKDEF